MGKKILIVDDDPVVRSLLTEYLTKHGYKVEVLSHGSECLQRLKTEQPDMLILDLIMPSMSGLQVLQSIREAQQTINLPVILLSANTESESGAYKIGIKADGYIQKPFEIKSMLEMIEQVFSRLRKTPD